MSDDTSLGGGLHQFPTTQWGLVSGPGAPIEALAQRYWKPIYRFIRAAWRRTNDDAKDLTQAFML